jgi:eukaryotic-like serine/threonine-protein kinase
VPGRLLRLARAIVGTAGLAVVFVVSAYLSFNLFVRRGATSVPELAGLAADEAERLLADQGLRYRAADPAGRWSDKVAEGRVLDSRPKAGSSVKRGSAVEIVVSLGARLARVPDLAGKAVSAAELTARAEGLELGEMLSVFAAGEAGVIVGQSPGAGASAPAGSKVDLLVALEAPESAFVMPDLVYRRFEPIKASLEKGGFRFGSVKFEPYEGIADGTILRQSPLPGHPLHRRDVISLVVAQSTPGVS